MIEVPQVVRAKARAVGAGRWLDDLPALVVDLERCWDLVVGAPFPDATEALVAPATTAAGVPVVLKAVVPRDGDGFDHEVAVLRLADGDGCARLLRADEDRGALLVERLGPSLHDLGVPLRRRQEVLCDLATHVWRPAPDAVLPTGADRAGGLADAIPRMWEEADRPCAERAVAHGVACAERRAGAHDDERSVLVHGDVHEWNALRAGTGFRLIDPDGVRAEPECDLGVLMREDPVALLAGDPWDRARWLAARTGCDVVAIWEWGVAERVSTGLLGTLVGLQPVAGQMLEAADRLAAPGS